MNPLDLTEKKRLYHIKRFADSLIENDNAFIDRSNQFSVDPNDREITVSDPLMRLHLTFQIPTYLPYKAANGPQAPTGPYVQVVIPVGMAIVDYISYTSFIYYEKVQADAPYSTEGVGIAMTKPNLGLDSWVTPSLILMILAHEAGHFIHGDTDNINMIHVQREGFQPYLRQDQLKGRRYADIRNTLLAVQTGVNYAEFYADLFGMQFLGYAPYMSAVHAMWMRRNLSPYGRFELLNRVSYLTECAQNIFGFQARSDWSMHIEFTELGSKYLPHLENSKEFASRIINP